MALLEVRNATKIYGSVDAPVVALQNISLEVEAGEFVALVGRSGCGKSTLLNLCGAMDFPSEGEISVDGHITSRLSDAELTCLRREKVGFIFQSFQLLNTLSVLENVELPMLLAKKKQREKALECLRWVEMAQYANRLPHQLSGGQQQRVAIARALVNSPNLILADEPTGNLDTVTGEIVLQLLRRIANEFHRAVIIATHSSESTARVDQIVYLRDGQMVESTVAR